MKAIAWAIIIASLHMWRAIMKDPLVADAIVFAIVYVSGWIGFFKHLHLKD